MTTDELDRLWAYIGATWARDVVAGSAIVREAWDPDLIGHDYVIAIAAARALSCLEDRLPSKAMMLESIAAEARARRRAAPLPKLAPPAVPVGVHGRLAAYDAAHPDPEHAGGFWRQGRKVLEMGHDPGEAAYKHWLAFSTTSLGRPRRRAATQEEQA